MKKVIISLFFILFSFNSYASLTFDVSYDNYTWNQNVDLGSTSSSSDFNNLKKDYNLSFNTVGFEVVSSHDGYLFLVGYKGDVADIELTEKSLNADIGDYDYSSIYAGYAYYVTDDKSVSYNVDLVYEEIDLAYNIGSNAYDESLTDLNVKLYYSSLTSYGRLSLRVDLGGIISTVEHEGVYYSTLNERLDAKSDSKNIGLFTNIAVNYSLTRSLEASFGYSFQVTESVSNGSVSYSNGNVVRFDGYESQKHTLGINLNYTF